MNEGMNPDVEYRDIPGYPGYKAGADGSIWSCRYVGHGGGLTDRWRRIKPWIGMTGYYMVALCIGGKLKKRKVHHLILLTFIGTRPEGMECCHGEGGRLDNSVGNVRWDTRQENIRDRRRHGHQTSGEDHPTARLTDEQIEEIRRSYRPRSKEGSQYALAKRFGVAQGHISNIIRRKRRARKGSGCGQGHTEVQWCGTGQC